MESASAKSKNRYWPIIKKTKLISLFIASLSISELFIPAYADDKNASSNSLEQALLLQEGSAGDYLSAVYSANIGAFDLSAAAYSRAYQASPKNLLLLLNYYKSLLLSGNIEAATPLAKNFLTEEPYSLSANILLASHAFSEGSFELAHKHLSAIRIPLASGAQNIHVLVVPLTLIWTEAAKGNLQAANKRLKVLEEIGVLPTAFLWTLKARLSSFEGDNERAARYFHMLVVENDIPDRYRYEALRFFRYQAQITSSELPISNWEREASEELRKNDQWRRLIQDATKEKPNLLLDEVRNGRRDILKRQLAEIFYEAAQSFQQAQMDSEMLAYAQLAAFVSPDFSANSLLLADYYYSSNEDEKAEKIYRNINKKDMYFIDSRLSLARLWYRQGRIAEAKKLLLNLAAEGKSEANNLKIESSLITLAGLLQDKKHYREAASRYSDVLKQLEAADSRRGKMLFLRGICYERAGLWKKAEADLLAAVALEPNLPETLNYIAYSWADRGERLDEAETMLEKALAIQPQSPQIQDSMGWVLFKKGIFDKAAQYIELASETTPYDPYINDHLGDVYWRQGRLREANYQWLRAIQSLTGEEEDSLVKTLHYKLENGLKSAPKPAMWRRLFTWIKKQCQF
jgi:Tfp pilus assembly protein PilF